MSRTFLIENTAVHSSTAHEIQDAVERAKLNGYDVHSDVPLVKFTFDLPELIKGIVTPRIKDDVLNRLTFSIDAYISGALSRMLNEFYQHSKAEDAELSFATYHDFLSHIEGLEATEQSLYETGCDVKSSVQRIRNLLAFRDELHSIIASKLHDPSKYAMPDIRDFLAKPQMRNLSAAAELGLRDIVEDDAGDDKELAEELMAQYKFDSQIERLQQHRMDVMKAKSLVLLFSCLKLDGGYTTSDDDAPFLDMDARTQFGMLSSTMKAILETRRRAVTDTRVPVIEKAALRVEAKSLVTTLTAQLAHARFAEFV